MPDLFLGAAAGPPGLPDWIDHAFPVPVKHGPAYLATAVAALGAVGAPFFQDSVLAGDGRRTHSNLRHQTSPTVTGRPPPVLSTTQTGSPPPPLTLTRQWCE